jgi:metal-sulfur cluster biosynthetic enzyme
MKHKENIYQALKTVIDPELGINIVDLGFIYDIQLKSKKNKLQSIHLTMTLTTPGCPLGGYFVDQVKQAISNTLSIKEEDIIVEIVFDPPWTPDIITESAKAELGFD